MVKPAMVQFHMPDEQGWRDIKRSCKLKGDRLKALRVALEVVDSECARLSRRLDHAEIKAALKTADRLFANLEAGLKRSDVARALRAIEAYGAAGVLMSATAASQFVCDQPEEEVPLEDLERLIARKRFLNEPVRASELDALSVLGRQRRLASLTPEVMLFATRWLRQPITSMLLLAEQDKGGLPAQIDREILIYILARNAGEIIGESASSTAKGKFHNLCAWVFGACGMDDTGLEAAISRCLKKHRSRLDWHEMPSYNSYVADLSDERLGPFPDDREQKP